MKKMPPELFNKYLLNPLGCDEEVRKCLALREDRYYTVSVWPENCAGNVYETRNVREVKNKKISKSDQK
jgi:hypothetical protein